MLSYELPLGVANNFFSYVSHRIVLHAHLHPPTNIPLILQTAATKLVYIMADSPLFNHKNFQNDFKFLSVVLFWTVNRIFCATL